jgi:hypothetical protein
MFVGDDAAAVDQFKEAPDIVGQAICYAVTGIRLLPALAIRSVGEGDGFGG